MRVQLLLRSQADGSRHHILILQIWWQWLELALLVLCQERVMWAYAVILLQTRLREGVGGYTRLAGFQLKQKSVIYFAGTAMQILNKRLLLDLQGHYYLTSLCNWCYPS